MVKLGYYSSLLTTLNIPWRKYKWLRLQFNLLISINIFQEQLDTVFGIANDIPTSSFNERSHDARVLDLSEMARTNNNHMKNNTNLDSVLQFFSYRLTSDILKVDLENIEAKVQM